MGQECKHYHICQTTKTGYIDTFRTLMLGVVLINLYEIFISYQSQPGNQKCVWKSLACFYFRRYRRYYRSFTHKCLFRNTWQNFIKKQSRKPISTTHTLIVQLFRNPINQYDRWVATHVGALARRAKTIVSPFGVKNKSCLKN